MGGPFLLSDRINCQLDDKFRLNEKNTGGTVPGGWIVEGGLIVVVGRCRLSLESLADYRGDFAKVAVRVVCGAILEGCDGDCCVGRWKGWALLSRIKRSHCVAFATEGS